VQAWSQQGFDGVDLLVDAGTDMYLVKPPEVMVDAKDSRSAILRIPKPDGVDDLALALMQRQITLTLIKDKTAIEKKISL
jgi:hypothetical protein